MRDKKGIGAIFAWIFILLAGSLIITLFIILAQGQAVNAKNTLSQRAFQNVNTIITTQQTTSNIATNVSIPQSDIRLSCRVFYDKNSESVALLNQLDIGGYAQPLDTQLITGRDMEASQLNVFSKKWNAPFSAGNILMVSNPDELVIYEEKTPNAYREEFADLFPENIDVKNASITPNIRMRQNVRVIIIDTSSSSSFSAFQPYEDSDNAIFMHVKPKDSGDTLAEGTITYYTEGQTGSLVASKPFTYFGEAMLLGYIWQGDAVRAACLQHKLAQALKTQIQIHIERVRILDAVYQPNSVCAAKLDSTSLKQLNESIGEPSTDSVGPTHKLYDLTGVSEEIEDLEIINENLLRRDSCATIY
jgi:Flp pilus assembly protein TadG